MMILPFIVFLSYLASAWFFILTSSFAGHPTYLLWLITLNHLYLLDCAFSHLCSLHILFSFMVFSLPFFILKKKKKSSHQKQTLKPFQNGSIFSKLDEILFPYVLITLWEISYFSSAGDLPNPGIKPVSFAL